MARCTKCGIREAFDTGGVPIHIEIEGQRKRTYTDPTCQECLHGDFEVERVRHLELKAVKIEEVPNGDNPRR